MTIATDSSVRPVVTEDTETMHTILCEAFAEDPVMNWLSDKPLFVPSIFHSIIPYVLPYDSCQIHSSGLGATAWMPPGNTMDVPIGLADILKACWQFGPGHLFRLNKLQTLIEREHPKEPHYYLFAIGTRYDAQGKGVGSSLLQSGVNRCDREGMPAYLENSNPRNFPLYKRYGFKVITEIKLPDGPSLWPMWREPAT